jgi:hypothetical protein
LLDPDTPGRNDNTLYFFDDGFADYSNVSHADGFGKLQHQLGVLAAIAYLDFNDFAQSTLF